MPMKVHWEIMPPRIAVMQLKPGGIYHHEDRRMSVRSYTVAAQLHL